MRCIFCCATTVVFWLSLLVASAFAQSGQAEPNRPSTAVPKTSRWQIGMIVTASGGACDGMSGYVAVPTEWPEQQVSVAKRDISPGVQISYELVDRGAKILNVRIPHLASGREAKALLTMEIRRSPITAPTDTSIYWSPDPKQLPPEILRYLQPSPKIESQDMKIRHLAPAIVAGNITAWDRVEAIYKWVFEKVQYEDGPFKGALAALEEGTGDCEERSALFIAMCRAVDIPARTVWVPDHCYAEFYLQDDRGEGSWFPCQSAGTPSFGHIAEEAPILQKGDSFRPPKPGMARQRYMAEYFNGMTTSNGGRPQVQFVRQEVAE
jgi:hypothetical protein